MIRAIIFDFDGVIADSEELHYIGLREALAQEGIRIDRRMYDDLYIALNDKDCFKEAFKAAERNLSQEKLLELIQYKSMTVKGALPEVKLFQGVSEWIQQQSRKVSLAICSGALRQEIIEVLSSNALLEHFTVIVSAEDVQRGKPSPEGYLLTLQRLNKLRRGKSELSAFECLVIEDSIAGVQAAKSANMRCAAITNSFSKDRLQNADFIFESIDELSLEKIQACLSQ